MSKQRLSWLPLVGVSALLGTGCGSDDHDHAHDHDHVHGDALFVAHEGTLKAYTFDGEEQPGAVQGVSAPVNMQALEDQTLLVNLTGSNEVLAIDGHEMLEQARIPSSSMGGTRPVHSYISPTRTGRRYWVALNDGQEGTPATNTALFVDITPGSPTYLEPAGEVALGVGHHKASFSTTQERIVISNIADCDNVLSVYDYSDVAHIQVLASLTSSDAGWDGSSYPKTCDPTYQAGMPPAPHGCATSKVSGKAYCNLTSSGDIVVVDIDATPPTFTLIPTTGLGAGYTKASLDGRYIYTLQEQPREGGETLPGAVCQIGQLVVIDAQADTVVGTTALGYEGPDCTKALLGTDEETANPGHIQILPSGTKLFITPAGGFEVADARVRQLLVVDLADPTHPVQLPSIPTGASSSHHDDTLTADGAFMFVANNEDGSVTQIDTAALSVVRTITVDAKPATVATFGLSGPSVQTGPIH